jgi:hypothetical protein
MVYYDAAVLKKIERRFFAIRNKAEEPDRYINMPEKSFVECFFALPHLLLNLGFPGRRNGRPLTGKLIAQGQGDQDGKPHEGGKQDHPHEPGTPPKMHEEKDHERGLADGNGQGHDCIPFAEVNERDACGEAGKHDQCRENQDIELFGNNMARHQ